MKKMLRTLVLVLAWTVCLGVAAAAAELPEEERYGRTVLEDYGYLAEAYDQIAEGVAMLQEKISLGGSGWSLTQNDLKTVMDAYIKDHPETVWMGDAYSYGMRGSEVVYLVPAYSMDAVAAWDAEIAMEEAAEELLSGIDESMSEFEKALEIHDRLAERVVYNGSDNCHNAYGALVEGVAVCDGYTEAYQYLLAKAGIQSYKVTGDSRGEGHAWNLVRIDGEYYHTDVTWDDQKNEIYHAYFNLTEQAMTEDHNIHWEENRLPLPECTSVEANYFAVKGGAVSELTVEAVTDAFRRSRDGVARIYVTPEVTEDPWSWFQQNIMGIVMELGITDGFSYGCSYIGREYHLSISGYVPPAGADIAIEVPGGSKIFFDGEVYLVADGKALIESVTDGTYDLQVKKTGCLTHTITDIAVEGEDLDLGTIELLAGDIDGNDLINARDINGFRREFGKSGAEIGNIAADMNGDGNVNARDINVLRKNFGKSAAKDCTVVWQG